MRHLIDWHLLDDDVWEASVARALYHRRHAREWTDDAHGKSIALMFFNPSLRTKTSMELAAAQLGAFSTTLTPGQGTWKFAFDRGTVMDGEEAEHIREAVGVLSRYYDAIGVRVFASLTDYPRDRDEHLIRTFAEAASVPVVNLESAFYHPCQALADAATMATHLNGDVARRRFLLTWAYHPKPLPMAVPNSAILAAARMGMDVTVARPPEYALDAQVMGLAKKYAVDRGASVTEIADLDAAFDGADIVYAKAWGGPMVYDDPDRETRLRKQYRDWRVTQPRMARTNDGAFMHCLPVRRNVVVDDDVLDGSNAIHLLQAEYRLHAQKAILEYLWQMSE